MSSQMFQCPEPGCEQSFKLARGLQRHLHETHGHPSYKERLATGDAVKGGPSSQNGGDPIVSDLDPRIEALAAPLRESIVEDEARLDAIERERQEIMARIRPIKAAITALTREHGKPGPRKFPGRGPGERVGQGAKKVSEQSIERLVRFMNAHADEIGDEFDAGRFNALMRENGEGMNISDCRRTLREMHERGLLRLLSSDGPGGRKMYARVAVRPSFHDREIERATP